MIGKVLRFLGLLNDDRDTGLWLVSENRGIFDSSCVSLMFYKKKNKEII